MRSSPLKATNQTENQLNTGEKRRYVWFCFLYSQWNLEQIQQLMINLCFYKLINSKEVHLKEIIFSPLLIWGLPEPGSGFAANGVLAISLPSMGPLLPL